MIFKRKKDGEKNRKAFREAEEAKVEFFYGKENIPLGMISLDISKPARVCLDPKKHFISGQDKINDWQLIFLNGEKFLGQTDFYYSLPFLKSFSSYREGDSYLIEGIGEEELDKHISAFKGFK